MQRAEVLICEAGTGTGKTFAYLVPSLLSGQRVIISTGTKNLQDQLFLRDLPTVMKALGVERRCAMLKGRRNYLCPHRLAQSEQGAAFRSPQQIDQLQRIRAWYTRSTDGDISAMHDIPEDSPVWTEVTSTVDNCLGQDCPEVSECPVVKARRAAQAADVLVINHYLLFSDMLLKDQGFGELLPGVDTLILDEAHQVADIASDFFGQTLSSRQLQELVNDSLSEYRQEAGDLPAFPDALTRTGRALSELRQALGDGPQRQPWKALLRRTNVSDRLERLQEELQYVQHLLETLAGRSKGLDTCWRRSTELLQRLALFGNSDDEAHIRWCELSRHGFVLHETPLDLAAPFQERMQAYQAAWVFTSATLSVGQAFEYFSGRLGLQAATARSWDSPFDYQRHACLYLPQGMPEPASPQYVRAVVNAAIPVIDACQGRTFVLFTSYRALREATRLLRDADLPYPLLVQGDAPKNELLQRFRQHGHAVLLGTGSFWEGVDVRGRSLSCVIIDKLPFATPDDPVLQARSELVRQNGGNPFRDYQLPNAVISLKQGVGRLIRDEQDRGILMLCDPRLTRKSYGRVFLQNLPAMQQAGGIDDVVDFLASETRPSATAPGSVQIPVTIT
jgi:ATP-dependent DNA helicase DinG